MPIALSQPIFTGSAPPKGLYHQLSLAADWLNRGYYGWKYGSLTSLAALSGERYRIAPGLNAASVALQSLYSQINPAPRWQQDVSSEGFVRHYQAYFGDPFARTDDKTIPSHLKQPTFILPFARGETWYFTGGPHNGWGRNSTWGALDFAPPDAGQNYSSCFVSEFPVRAMANGQVVYSDAGLVLQDLDSDGDPGTGWLLLYLHMSAEGRVAIGSQLFCRRRHRLSILRRRILVSYTRAYRPPLQRRMDSRRLPELSDNGETYHRSRWVVGAQKVSPIANIRAALCAMMKRASPSRGGITP